MILLGSIGSATEPSVPRITVRTTCVCAVRSARVVAHPLHFATSMRKPTVSRRRSRGMTTIETILCTTALMGCFVYPLSLAMRPTGARLVDDSDRSHEAMLNQPR